MGGWAGGWLVSRSVGQLVSLTMQQGHFPNLLNDPNNYKESVLLCAHVPR